MIKIVNFPPYAPPRGPTLIGSCSIALELYPSHRRIDGIAVEKDAEQDRILARREALRKRDCEAPIFVPLHLVHLENRAIGADQEIAGADEQAFGPTRSRPQERLFYEA